MTDPIPPGDAATSDLNAQFLTSFFEYAGNACNSPRVFLTSLGNDRGGKEIRHERTAPIDAEELLLNRERVLSKYDRDGQAAYFCVSALDADKVRTRHERVYAETGKEPFSERCKETVGEILAAHVDIDLKQIRIGWAEALRRLGSLEKPPTTCVLSGNGVHAYWFYTEALEATDDAIIDQEALLRRIARVTAGDPQCCEVARLLRIPGSHNTKNGDFKLVEVVRDHTDFSRRYEFFDLGHELINRIPKYRRV